MAIYNTLVKYRRTGQLNLVHLAYNDLHKASDSYKLLKCF